MGLRTVGFPQALEDELLAIAFSQKPFHGVHGEVSVYSIWFEWSPHTDNVYVRMAGFMEDGTEVHFRTTIPVHLLKWDNPHKRMSVVDLPDWI